MATLSGEFVELEAMRKEDCSWHPCHVSLSSSDARSGIVVDFGSCTEEDTISNKKDVLTRLRLRSTPLQDGECFHVKEGEYVLAMHKVQSRSLYFDAVVEKVCRVKHSKRVYCRCTFEIKWLHSELKGKTMSVPSNSIMKLSSKGINTHPMVAAFFNSLNPTNNMEVPSYLSLLEETIFEADLQGLLEKQIEEISKLGDGSKNGCSEDFLLRVELNRRSTRSKVVIASQRDSLHSQNDFRRSSRSQKTQNKQQTGMEVKEHLDDKPFLSPLAARAALASLVHELPEKTEISICHVERGHVDPTLKDPQKLIKVLSLDGVHVLNSDVCIQDDISIASKAPQKSKNDIFGKARHESTSSPSSATRKSQSNEESPAVLTMQEKPAQASKDSEDRKPRRHSIVKHPADLVADKKLNDRAITTRCTRSAARKGTTDSTDAVEQGSSTQNLNSPSNTMRLTRFGKQKEKNDLDVKQELEKSNLIHDTLDRSVDLITPMNSETKKKKFITSPGTPEALEQGSLKENFNSPINRMRLTRSANQKEKSDLDVNQELGKSKLIQDTPMNSETKKKKSITSPINPDTDLALERKKRRVSSVITVAEEDRGESPRDDESFLAEKKKAFSSKKPELRFSPRLKFLPRTRSQKKSSLAC